MTWPAPTSSPALPPSPSAPPPDERRGTARPVASWLATTGGSLVLVAAIVAVAGNWQDIAAWIKLAGLLTITATVVVGAERARMSLPATARAMAHLGAALVAPVGIAAAAMASQPWPVCVVTGGVLGAVACDIQARRWQAPLLDAATIIAVGLALTGVAALMPVPVGLLGAVAGCALLLARRDTAAATFALAGAASPILVALAEQRVGDGTLDRIGATGDVLTWSAPVAGVLAGLVLAVVATGRDSAPLAAAALAAPAIGTITGFGAGDVDAAMWASLPGVGLIALESVVALAGTGPWRRVATPVADVVGAVVAVAALGSPAIALAVDVPVLPIALTATGLAMSTVRRPGRNGDLTAAGAGVVAIAGALALGSPLLGAAAVAAAVAAVAAAGRRVSMLATAGAWGAALVLAARPAGDGWVSALAVGIAVTLMAAAIELRLAREGRNADLVTALVAGAGALLAALCCAAGREAVLVAGLAFAVVHVAVRRPARAAPLLAVATIVTGSVAMAVLDDAERAAIDTSFGLGLLALAAAAAVTWRRAGASWAAHAAAVAVVAAVPFGLAGLGAGAAEAAIALMILAVVLTGWAFVTIRLTPIGSAGIAAGAFAAAIAYDAPEPLLASLAVTVVGVQGALHGATRRSPELLWSGLGLAGVGTVSTWFTSGANTALIEWLGPHGVTAGDVSVAALAALLFGAGALAGRAIGCSSWVASGPGLGLVGAWLLGTELTRDVRWSLPLLLVTGLLAMGIGGVRRRAAPLVLGTAMIATTVGTAAGPRLADLDTWVWLAFGGAALIALAVLVERTVNGEESDGPDWRRLRQTWR